MVPKKKGKRVIKINQDNLQPERQAEGTNNDVDNESKVPTALERALNHAVEAERDVLKHNVEELEGRVGELEEELNRERAKLQNVRRRADEEMQEVRKYGAYDLAFDLLNILDCLELGMNCNVEAPPEVLKPYIEGVDYTIQELMRVLRKNGIEEIPTDISYDPNLHQVFECIEDSTEEPGTIIDVKRKGYKLHDRVLRTALVSIAGMPNERPAEDDNGE
jgi:molecular chaperone GrpE